MLLVLRQDQAWLRTLRYQWEALGNRWNLWVLGYNSERQREFMSSLGVLNPDWKDLATALLGAVGTILLVLVVWSLRSRTRPPVRHFVVCLPWKGIGENCAGDSSGAPLGQWVFRDYNPGAASAPRICPRLISCGAPLALQISGTVVRLSTLVLRLRLTPARTSARGIFPSACAWSRRVP